MEHHTIKKMEPSLQLPPRTLLDEYQYDDAETMDLLQAIKNWNLKKRSCHDSPQNPDDTGDASLGSTIETHTTDYDTLTAVSTNTSKGGHASSSAVKSAPKTPLCNYSSRPSFLTARILNDNDLLPVMPGGTDSSNMKQQQQQQQQQDDDEQTKTKSIAEGNTRTNITTDVDEPHHDSSALIVDLKTTKRPERGPFPSMAQDSKNSASQETERDPISFGNLEALDVLRNTAAELGLSRDELGLVLPTVQKLVQVITQHVPRLESFVEQVCETVLIDDPEENSLKDEINQSRPKRRHKKRSRKNMQARSERMEDALKTLKSGWKVRSMNDEKEHCSVLHRLDVNGEDVVDHRFVTNGISSFPYQDYQSYGSFTMEVKDRLSKRNHHRASSLSKLKDSSVLSTKDPSVTGNLKDPLLTDAEALEEIDRLIEVEERYVHNVNLLLNGEENEPFSSTTNDQSSQQTDTVLQDLLNADTTTLRRFVLHFAYLFSVRQENILGKMNDLYVFSHEATSLINDIKNCLGLPLDCPLHSVARQVISTIQNGQN